MSVTQMMHAMHKRPDPGQHITVFLKEGGAIDCNATMIWSADFNGIMIYHDGKAIDEEQAIGWLPWSPNQREGL